MVDLSVYDKLQSFSQIQRANEQQAMQDQMLRQQMETGALQQQKLQKEIELGGTGIGGATGELVQRLMQENPDMKFGDALAQVQTGYRKGVTFGEGGAAPIAGMPEALGGLEYGKEAGKRRAELGSARPIAEAKAMGAGLGRSQGEARALLSEMKAYQPKLEQTAKKLSQLGKKATYTLGGRTLDAIMRETGQEPRESAVARAEYISTVDNEILPLLRQTFGAAFTVKEGESLRATLGDANVAPAQKDAVLRAFIDNKRTQIKALQRQTGGSEQARQQFDDRKKLKSNRVKYNPATGEFE